GAATQVVVPVTARPEGVLRVVGVNEIDSSGDRLHPVHDVEQILAAGMRVAGVQAETHVELADRVPQPGQVLQPAGAGVVPARGVLDQYGGGEAAGLGRVHEGLAPVVDAGGQVVAGAHVSSVHDESLRADGGGR